MVSKMVTDRRKSSDSVQSAGHEYENNIVESIGRIFGSEAGVAAGTLARAAVVTLKTDTDDMLTADNVHQGEIADDTSVIEDKTEKSTAVRASLVETREMSGAVYGPAFVRELGFEGLTPVDPVAVHQLGVLVLDKLRTIEAPKPKNPAIKMDLGALTGPLADSLGELNAAIKVVSDEKKQAVTKLSAKNKSIDKYDEIFSAAANLISTMLRVSGEEELAGKVRPSTRRPGNTAEIGDVKPPTTPDTPDIA